MNAIYPCIWFDNNALEATTFYADTFKQVKIVTQNPMVVIFEINGVQFMGLNGGNMFQPNPAISYFVYCENDTESIETLYHKLKDGGKVLMPLDTYDWSKKYAWVEDKFGVSWQLDIDAINHSQKIVPALLFTNKKAGKVKEALSYYASVFNDSSILMEMPHPANPTELLFAQFKLNHYLFNAMSGGNETHAFDFSEGNSFVIECDTQKELDHYWTTFARDGKESNCGWVQDAYGVWWQIIPSMLMGLMSNPETAKKVGDALMKMKKIDISTLKSAAE